MVNYTFYVKDDTGIASKITQLINRISIDLDITKVLSSPSNSYNAGTKILTISFDTALTENEQVVLSRLVDISILGFVPGVDVQSSFYNQLPRESYSSTIVPGATHDIASYYMVGSRVINQSTGNVWVCTQNTLNNAVWKRLVTGLSIEGATGSTGTAYTGPITVSNTDTIRYWSQNLEYDVSTGSSGPLIKIDTPGPIGFGAGIGAFQLIFYSDQGAGYQSYVNFNNSANFAEVTQFIYSGTGSLGGIPQTIKILFAGRATGGVPSYTINLRLVDIINVQTILNWSRTIVQGVDVVAIENPLVQTLTAIGDPLIFTPQFLPVGESRLSLVMRCSTGNESRLYNIQLF